MNKPVCTGIALLSGVLLPLCAQQPLVVQQLPPVAQQPAFVLPSRLNSPVPRDRAEGLIKLDVMVTDAAGKPMAGLNPSDFHLLEDGREQKILLFQAFTGQGAGAEPPVKIILLIDTIDMAPQQARDERNAVECFLRENGGRLARPTSVFELTNVGLWTLRNQVTDGNILASEVEHNRFTMIRRNLGWNAGTGQSTHPSEYALKALGHIASDERRRPGRKLLIWIGATWGVGKAASGELKGDSGLFQTVCWFSDLLREAHLVLSSVSAGQNDAGAQLYKEYLGGVSTPKRATLMNLHRMVLAMQSGGRVIDDSRALFQAMKECVQDIGPFYRISFDPLHAERQDEYHDLKGRGRRPKPYRTHKYRLLR